MNKKKAIPGVLQNQFLIRLLRSDIGIVLSYWTFQGMLYMDVRESMFKIGLDFVMTFLFLIGGVPLIPAFISAHTINMLLNGHHYVLMHNMGRLNNDPAKFLDSIRGLHARLQNADFLIGAAAYGSLSRGQYGASSDADVRVFPKRRFLDWLRAVLWVVSERARALIQAFPLDIYAFDLGTIDAKMRADEPPIILHDPESILRQKYEKHILFEEFAEEFKETYVQRTI